MNRAEIEEAAAAIIERHLLVERAEITPGAHFVEDFGADSMDIVELAMEFEETFDIVIPDEEAEKVQTVKQVYDYLVAKITKPRR